jgi:hypothetical protein
LKPCAFKLRGTTEFNLHSPTDGRRQRQRRQNVLGDFRRRRRRRRRRRGRRELTHRIRVPRPRHQRQDDREKAEEVAEVDDVVLGEDPLHAVPEPLSRLDELGGIHVVQLELDVHRVRALNAVLELPVVQQFRARAVAAPIPRRQFSSLNILFKGGSGSLSQQGALISKSRGKKQVAGSDSFLRILLTRGSR